MPALESNQYSNGVTAGIRRSFLDVSNNPFEVFFAILSENR